MLQIACLSLLLSLTTVKAGVCAGCPTTQHVVDKEHLAMVDKAFKLLKEKNPNILLGSDASLVPESFQTQVVAGTKFIFEIQTNIGEHVRCVVFRSLPEWSTDNGDGNTGKVTYSMSSATYMGSVGAHQVHGEGGGNGFVIGPAVTDKSSSSPEFKSLPTWEKSIEP